MLACSTPPGRRLSVRTALGFAVAVASAVAWSVGIIGWSAAAAPPVQAAATFPVHGIDVSAHQNDGSREIDWPTVARHEHFATIKATEGTDYTSPYFNRGWQQMTAASIPRAPYHFLMPSDQGSAAAQAQYFVRQARAAGYTGTQPGELPPVVDVEWDHRDGSCLTGVTAANVLQFLEIVRQGFGRTPLVYTNAQFLLQCGLDSRVFAGSSLLWIAHYSSSAASPPVPAGWSTWTVWQYTDRATVPGVPKATDRNWFNGDLPALRALAGLGGAPSGCPSSTVDANNTTDRRTAKSQDMYGRTLELRYGSHAGRQVSWARVTGGTRTGDRVWIDWSTDGARTWKQCGPYGLQGDAGSDGWTPALYTSSDPNVRFRACGDVLTPPAGQPRSRCTDWW